MSTKFDIRQSISRDSLDQLATAAGKEVDDLLRSINSELTMPLRMTGNTSLVVSIGALQLTNPEHSRKRLIPPISNVIPSFVSGTITVGATGAGNATPSIGSPIALGMSASQYMKIGVHLNALGQLVLTKGATAPNEFAAPAPAVPSNTYAIGFFLVQTDPSNNVSNITNTHIYQYVGGGTGGGSGDASTILETLKNQFVDSPYNLLTPNIFASDEDNKVDGSSTGEFNLVSSAFEMDSAETMVSTQMLDPDEFLALGKGLESISLSAFWNPASIDDAATYEVSRNGGNEWQEVTMERVGEATETFYGSHEFEEEASNDIITDNSATRTTTAGLNGSNKRQAQSFTITNTTVLRQVTFYNNVTGSPAGNLYIQILADDGGFPSLDPNDILLESPAFPASSVVNASTNTFDIGEVVLPPGLYYASIRGDAAYRVGADPATSFITLQGDVSANGRYQWDEVGGSYTDVANASIELVTEGIELDLRVRITASQNDVALDGYGIFYDNDPVTVVDNVLQLEVRQFKAVADNFSTFTLTNFLPNADLLKVYYVQGGQVYHYGAFSLQGQDVIFPVNSFNNNAVEADITLVFDQMRGGAYDNSDTNAALLAANHLGSTDGTIDKSQNGRGIFLRRPDGTLRELSIDNNDDIIISSI